MAYRTLEDLTTAGAAAAERIAMAQPSRRHLLAGAAGGAVLLGAAILYETGAIGRILGAPPPGEAPAPVFYDLPDLLVNLNVSGRRPSFLKLSLSLELARADDLPRLKAVMPRVIDAFQLYLRELRPEDLQGSAGLYRLREELLVRINAAAAPVRVADVLFREMLVQ